MNLKPALTRVDPKHIFHITRHFNRISTSQICKYKNKQKNKNITFLFTLKFGLTALINKEANHI